MVWKSNCPMERVPSGTEDLYKKDKGWKKFKHIEGF
jgi:hypothetical protein